MRKTWKRVLVMFLVVAMLMTDSSLSEVIYAASQSTQTDIAPQGTDAGTEEEPGIVDDGNSMDTVENPSDTGEGDTVDVSNTDTDNIVDSGTGDGDGNDTADTDEDSDTDDTVDTTDPDADDGDTKEPMNPGPDDEDGNDVTDSGTDAADTEDADESDEEAEKQEDVDIQKSDLSINSTNAPMLLNAGSVDELTEEQKKILDAAKKLYGDGEEKGSNNLVRYDYGPLSKTTYMAGEDMRITVYQKLYTPENYSYNSTNRFIADTIQNMTVTLQLPDGLTFKKCELGSNTYLESYTYNEETRKLTLKYRDSFGMPSAQSTSSFLITATIDGNGGKADGEEIEIDDIKVVDFSASLPILDYPGGSAQVIWDLPVKHSYTEADAIADTVTLTSPDTWGVVASTDFQPDTGADWYYDEEGNIVMTWTVAAALQNPNANETANTYEKLYITDAKLLQALNRNMDESSAALQASLNSGKYTEPGRAPLDGTEEKPYVLTSTVYAEDGVDKVYPTSLEIQLVTKDGDTPKDAEKAALKATSIAPKDGVEFTNYLVAGEGSVLGKDAPMYSTYKVTAVFPKDQFITPFYEKLRTYEFVNEVSLTNTVAGKEEAEFTDRTNGTYSAFTESYPVELTQVISMGEGMDLVYDEENVSGILAPFTGTVTYELKKKQEDGTWTAYGFYERGKDGADSFVISSEGTHLGTTTIYLEEGTYRLSRKNDEKIAYADWKGGSGAPSITDAKDLYEFTVAPQGDEEEPVAVYLNYEATGTRILFSLKDEEDRTTPLPGAEYTLYDKAGKEVKRITSTQSGYVVFAALEKEVYTLKETRAPEGYILDDKEYEIDATKDGSVNFYPNADRTLYNENNTYAGGTVTVEKYLSQFQEGAYKTELQTISNSYVSSSDHPFHRGTFRVEEYADGDWKESDVRVEVTNDGRLAITELQKYKLDSGSGKKDGLMRYRIVEILPTGYDNSSMNTDARAEIQEGQRMVVYPEFTVKDVFGYGTEKTDQAETFTYYNEKINKLTVSQTLLDEENYPNTPWQDSDIVFQLFYRLGEEGALTKYEPSEEFHPTDSTGQTSVSGLPTAMKDKNGAYVPVQWYAGQICGSYEQIEYKTESGYRQAEQSEVDGKIWNLIPFDFSSSTDVKLESFRLVMKRALTIYKRDATDNSVVEGAEFWVTYGENIEIEKSGSGNSQIGITYWAPMSEELTIQEIQAPDGYMKGDPISLEACVPKDEWRTVTPENYSSYASQSLDSNKYYYNDDKFPVLTVKKMNYRYEEPANDSVEADSESVEFELYEKTTGPDGENIFTKVYAVYENGVYKGGLSNGTLNYMEPGADYYLAEVSDEILEDYIDPALLEGSGVSPAGVIYQDGRAYYPVGEQKANGGTTTVLVTNYSNTSGWLTVKVEDARTEAPFAPGQVKIRAVAVDSEGTEHSYEAEVDGKGEAVFHGMQIFDANGKKLTYSITQSADHPDYSHDASSYQVELKIGEETGIEGLEEGYAFVEYPRVDVYAQVNWVEDLTYLQLSEEEQPSAQQRLAGAVMNVYQKMTDPDGSVYYELIQTCTSNENGTLIAEGLEEFPSYVFVKAGYDPQRHEEALNPEPTGEKRFDKNRYDPAKVVRITQEELEEKYDYMEYQYANPEKNSSITPGIVAELDTVKEPILFHELWMQVKTSKKLFYTQDLDGDGKYDGIFRITKNEGDAEKPWHYVQYPNASFSNANQYGEARANGDWTDEELEDYIKRTTISKEGKEGTYGKVVYDNDGNPTAILYGRFSNAQNARYSLYQVKLADLTEDQIEVDGDGHVTISMDFKNGSGWELMDDTMITDEFGEAASREQVADDGYVYFLVETGQPSSSLGMSASNQILGTNYVTVYYKSGAEYTFDDVTAKVGEITYQCITVNYNGAQNSSGYVGTTVRPYNIDVDTDDIQLNKGAIGADSNYTGNYAYIQFNKWKDNRAYDANDPNGEHKYAPVSSAKFDVYLTNGDHSYKKKLNSRTYQSVKSTYSSDAYVTTDNFNWNSQYRGYLEAVLNAYSKQQGGGPNSLSSLRTAYTELDDEKNVVSVDVGKLNQYVKDAMEACGGTYEGIFYLSNVITNIGETPEDILNAADARKDGYNHWGFAESGKESTAGALSNSSDMAIATKAQEVLNSEPAYFDLFDMSGDNKNAAVGFAQQVAYNYCMSAQINSCVDYAVVDGFPVNGEGVTYGGGNSYGTRTGTYRITYMHCSILEVEAPVGTFLNTDYKDLMLQSGSYVHRTNGGNWGSIYETGTMTYANTYRGKNNNPAYVNRTWYYSDEKLINQLGDVSPEVYISMGKVGNVTYTAAAKYNSQDRDNQYLNAAAAEANQIIYRTLTTNETKTGYIPGKAYIDETQAGFTVRVQAMGYPSQMSTYGKTDNELQTLYEANELTPRPGLLGAEYKLQKLNEDGTAYEDFVYPKVLADGLGHARQEEEDEEACILKTYEENTDEDQEAEADPQKACVFTFPQGLGTGVYRLVPAKTAGTLIGEDQVSLNRCYYDPYKEAGAYRYFTVSRTSADQYVDVFYPELPNIRVIKQENNSSGNPYRTTDSVIFELKSTNGYEADTADHPMNIAEFEYLGEGEYKLTEELTTSSSGDLTALYFKKNSGLELEVIREEGGNRKTQTLVGTATDENGVTITKNYEVDAPVFYGYQIISTSGSVVAPEPRVTETSKDAYANSAITMATTFQVYVTNPEKQRFQIQKLDALSGRGLQNAEFDIYFRPFDAGSITVNEKNSNNQVTLKTSPAVPSSTGTDGKLTGNGWSYYQTYLSNSNGLLMDQEEQRLGVYGEPGWYYVVETKAPTGMSYDIADPVLFAFTGTLQTDDQSGGSVQQVNTGSYVQIHDSDKVELNVSKYFAASNLIEAHTVSEYDLSLYQDEKCTVPAKLYNYADGIYTVRNGAQILTGSKGYTVQAGKEDFIAGSGTVYVDYNDSGVYYLKETMTASSPEEAKLWIAQCAERSSSVYSPSEYVSSMASGNQVTVIWKLKGFSGETVNDRHQVEARVWNTYASASVKMFKTIATNQDYPLGDAEFELYDPVTGNVLATAVSSGAAKTDGAQRYNVEFTVPFSREDLGLTANGVDGKPNFTEKRFNVRETKAPAGYQVSATLWNGSVQAGQTLYLKDTNGNDYIDSDGITFRVTKYDNVEASALKKPEKDQGFSLYVKEEDGWTKVSNTVYTGSQGSITFPAVSVGTDQERYQYALKYDGPKDADAASTYAVDSLKISVNNQDHDILGTEAEDESTYYILNDEDSGIAFVAGMTYGVTAYDIPKSSLTVSKRILQEDDSELNGRAVFGLHKLTEAERLTDAEAVKKAIAGYKETDYQSSSLLASSHTFTGLTAGSYLVWEIRSDSTIVLDDRSVVWYQIVEIDPAENQGIHAYTAILKNRESSVAPAISKSVDQKTVKSLMDQPAELTYTITPSLYTTGSGHVQKALLSYEVKDTGLRFYTDTSGSKEASDAPDYHFTTMSLTAPSYTDGNVGTFQAEVTFYNKEGETVGAETKTLPALDWDISKYQAAAFDISYQDVVYEGVHAGYAAGENLAAGEITVQAHVEESVQSPDLQEIRLIRNSSSLEIASQKWGESFTESVKGESEQQSALAAAATEVDPVSVPTLGIRKYVNPKGEVNVGDNTLTYSIYAFNISTTPVEEVVLIDWLPKGLSVDTSDGFFTLNHRKGDGELIKELQAGTDVTVQSFVSGGRTALAFQIHGEKLGNSEYYELILNQGYCTVTNDAVEAGKLVNEGYVTVVKKGYQYERNQSGGAFKEENKDSDPAGLNNEAMDKTLLADVEKNLGKTLYGVLRAEKENNVSPGTGLVPAKSEQGDRDSVQAWISAPTAVTQVSRNKGTVDYRLSVTNAEGADKKDVILFDVLPYEGDTTGSKWTLELGDLEAVTVTKTFADKRTEILTKGKDYTVTPGQRPEDYKPTLDAVIDYKELIWPENPTENEVYSAVKFQYHGTLTKGETLTVTFRATVPKVEGNQLDEWIYQEALNRFGVFSNTNGTPDESSAVYSNVVKAQLVPETVALKGQLWIDADQDHVQDVNETSFYNYEVVEKLISELKLTLNGYQKAESTATKVGDTPFSTADGTYRFEGLTPARPVPGKLSELYLSGKLNPLALLGSAVSYRLTLTYEGSDQDLIQLAEPGAYTSYSYANDSALTEEGYGDIEVSETLRLGDEAVRTSMETDSDIRSANGLQGASDQFFLFSGTDGTKANTVTNDQEDVGVQVNRQVTVTKKDSLGNPLGNVSFTLYQYPMETERFDDAGTEIGTYTTDENGQFSFTVNYFNDYKLVETSANAAYSGKTSLDSSYKDITQQKDKSWIIKCNGTGKDYSGLRESMTITNELATGSVLFRKQKELAGGSLAAAEESDDFRFCLTYKGTDPVGQQAWTAYLNSIAGQQAALLSGCSYVAAQDSGLIVKVTGAETEIKGLPMGIYEIQEVKNDGYVAADTVEVMLGAHGQTAQIYNKDTASANILIKAVRGIRNAVRNLLGGPESTTKVQVLREGEEASNTKTLVNYRNHAELTVVKTGNDGTEKNLAGAEFTLCADADGDHTSETEASHANCAQTVYQITEADRGVTIDFENLENGVSHFYLRETKSPGDLWAVNPTLWHITVTVEAGKQPVVQVDNTDGNSNFQNGTLTVKDEYLKREGSISFTDGKKKINNGAAADSALSEAAKESMRFSIYEAELKPGTNDYIVSETAIRTVDFKPEKNGFAFENFAAYSETDHGKNFYYAVCENEIGTEYSEYLSKDSTWYILQVYVQNDPNDGSRMKAEITDIYSSSTYDETTRTISNVSKAADGLTFNNQYTTKAGKYSLKVQKTLKGRELTENDDFTAALTQYYRSGDSLIPVSGSGTEVPFQKDETASYTGMAAFEKKLDAFTDAGFYYYQVTEKKGTADADGVYRKDGVVYDNRAYYLLFWVEDDGAGSMEPELIGVYDSASECLEGQKEYEDQKGSTGLSAFFRNLMAPNPRKADGNGMFDLTADINFVNTYTASPASLRLTAGKTLEGRSIGGNEFQFQIEGADEASKACIGDTGSGSQWVSAVSGETKGTAVFDQMTFQKAGTYTFTVKELDEQGYRSKYVTYDSTIYTVSVTVEDGGDGQLYVTAVTVKKGEGTAESLYEPGSGSKGMASGSLNLSEKVNFTNTYQSAATLTISGKKDVTDETGAPLALSSLTTKTFQMTIQQTDSNYQPAKDMHSETATTTEDGTYKFGLINYTQESFSDPGQTEANFYYIVTEADATASGFVKNDTVHKIHVILTRNDDGSLSLSAENGEDSTKLALDERTATTETTKAYGLGGQDFTNEYHAKGTLELFGTKELIGKNLTNGMFKFMVKDEAGQVVASGSNDEDGTVSFDKELIYTAKDIGKTFHYTVSEDDALPTGYSMNGTNSHNLAVQVTDGGNGRLSINANIDGDVDPAKNKATGTDGEYTIAKTSGLSFFNKYDIKEIKMNLTAYKSVNGSTALSHYLDADPEFKFSLYEAVYDSVTNKITRNKPVSGQTEKTVNLASHSVIFEDIIYGADSLKDSVTEKYVDALTKYYLITEDTLTEDAAKKNFAQGDSSVAVKVELRTDADGMLGGSASYALVDKDGIVGTFGTDASNSTINNTYTDSLSLKISGTVGLESQIRDMVDQSFTVTVSGGDLSSAQSFTIGGSGTADNKKSVNYSSADAVFNFNQNDVGQTYEYTVTQTKMTQNGSEYSRSGDKFGAAGGYTADTATYRIKVTIGVDANGKLKADYEIPELATTDSTRGTGTFTSDGDSTKVDGTFTDLDFTNMYKATGDILLREDTTFRAVNGTDTTVQDWLGLSKNNQSGFQYKVSAIADANAVPGSDDQITTGTSVVGDFPESTVPGVNDNSKRQTSSAKDLAAVGKSYTEQKDVLGTWYYYVEQVIPENAENDVLNGLTYGSDGVHAYVVKAELTDDPAANGQLKVTYSYQPRTNGASWSTESMIVPTLSFLNSYEASGTVLLEGTKTLKNRNMEAGEFTFTLKQTTVADANAETSSLGETELSVKNEKASAEAKTAFQWKQSGKDYTDSYTAVGEYTYLAAETTPLPAGVTATVDSETLTVKVKDNHDGTLDTSEVSGSAAQDGVADFVNNYQSGGSIVITGKKTINGMPLNGKQQYADDTFKFTLYEGDNYNVSVGSAESDAKTGLFGIMDSYTHDDMLVNGSYQTSVKKTYFLKETEPAKEHYVQGGNQYVITVTLTDDQQGHISAYISKIQDVKGKAVSEWSTVEGEEFGNGVLSRVFGQVANENDLIFDNTYSTSTTASIRGKKTAKGFTLTTGADSVPEQKFANSHFAFLLYNCDENGNVAADAQPIDIAELGTDGTFTFDNLTFRYTDGTGKNGDDAGAHYYKVVEAKVPDDKTEIAYTTVTDSHFPDKETEAKTITKVSDMQYSDEAYVVKIDVVYNSQSGALTATPTVISPTGSTKAEFTNTYRTGTFTLGGDGSTGIEVISAYEAEPGTNTIYTDSKVTYSYTMTPVDENGDSLTNPPTGIASSTKDMSQAAYKSSAAVNTGNINSVSANVTFDGQTIHNTDDRYFKITQKVNDGASNPGMTYDEGYYIIKVTTTVDSADNTKLISSVDRNTISYYDKAGNKVRTLMATDPIRFTNVYHADPLKLSFEATKVLTGRYMFEDEFGFTLTGTAANDVYGYTTPYNKTVKNSAAAADTPSEITFDEDTLNGVGTYSYELKENVSGAASVTDDTASYNASFTVVDNNQGSLVFADSSINGLTIGSGTFNGTYDFDVQKGTKEANFVNKYTSTSKPSDPGTGAAGDLVLTGTKTINGLAMDETYLNRTGEFSFKLVETDANGDVLMGAADTPLFETSATADDDGTFKLTISYTQDAMKTSTGQSGDFAAGGKTVEAADSSAAGSSRKSQTVYHYYKLTENDTVTDHKYGKSEVSYLLKAALVDNYDGTITASVAGISKDSETLDRTDVSANNTVLTFDNTYKATGSITLQGTKLTSGFALNEPATYVYADEFSFELYNADKNGKYDKTSDPLQTTKLDQEANGEYKSTFTFKSIEYAMNPTKKAEDLGDHYYVIRETQGSTKGMVYDTREYLVHVTVEDAGSGNLKVDISDVSQLTMNKILLFEWTTTTPVDFLSFKNVYQSGGIDLYASNRYVAEDGTETDLKALKETQGASKTEFSFAMNLSNADGEIVDTTDLEGLRLSETKTVKYVDENTSDFIAEQQPADGGSAERAVFDFLHMKENNLRVLKEWLNDLNFHSTGTFYLRIDQVIPEDSEKASGVQYDDGYYLVEITVTDSEADKYGDASKDLKAEVSSIRYYNAQGEIQNTVTNQEKELTDPDVLKSTIVFTNIYRAAPSGLTLETSKTTDKRSMAADEFKFVLTGTREWLTENGETRTETEAFNQAAGADEAAKVLFERMQFNGVGTYTYTLTEQQPADEEALGGIIYSDTVYTITVEVTDDHKGALHTAITSIRKDGEELIAQPEIEVSDDQTAVTALSEYGVTFSNRYTIAEETVVTVQGTKTVNGRSAGLFLNNQFTFDLFPAEYEDGVYEAVSDEAVDTAVSHIVDGTFELSAAFVQDDLFTEEEDGSKVWNQEKDHYFIIKEQSVTDTGYAMNKASIGITVTLTDNLDGTLTAKITGMTVQTDSKNGAESGTAAIEKSVDDQGNTIYEGIRFDNVYKASGTLEIAGTKKIEGMELKNAEPFTFEIVDEEENVIGTASNDTKGKIQFILTCDESFIGETRTFRLREVDDERPDMTYDETEYQWKVTTEDAGNGSLKLSAELLLKGKKVDKAEFRNIYSSGKKHSSGSSDTAAAQQSVIGILLPQTGDTAGIAGYLFLMIAASGGIFTVGKKRRKKNTKGK